jgi:predicted permease
MLESMRVAIRSLSRRPAFTLAALLTVALGIGANTALFAVVYSVLIRPLPFRDPGKLVQIWQTHPALPQLQVTAPDFRNWQEEARSFEQIAAYTLSAMNTATLLGQGEPAVVHATMTTGNLFPAMRIQPSLGRAFNDAEERTKQRVALINENLWRRKFGANPSIIGRQIRLDAESFQVIGIVPGRQAFPESADLWIPLSLMEVELQTRRKYHPLEVIGRLKPHVSPEQAQSEMQMIARRAAQAHSETNATVGAYVIPLTQEMTQDLRPSLLLAWAAVGLVLLIACANLAHLFLARIIERHQEMAIREALGAKTRHLIGQLLTESLLIVAIGGGLGVLCAGWVGQLLPKIAAGQVRQLEWTTFDGPVWLFAVGIALLSALLFGLPACWQLMRRRTSLSGSGRSIVRAQSRLSSVLMAGEVAMALVVLSGAALLTRNFAELLNQDPGFQTNHVWTIPKIPLRGGWDQSEELFATRLAPALRDIPGVVDVAAVNSAPLSLGLTEHSRYATRFGIEAQAFDSGKYPVAQNRWITPDYFRVLGIPLKSGRWLAEADRGKPRILVNETLARRFFRNRDPLGKQLVLGVMDTNRNLNEIVGVVGDVRDLGLDREPEPTLYTLAAGPVMTLLVKTSVDSQGFAATLRETIHRVDPEIPVTKVQPLQQNLADSLARKQFALILLAIFGGMAAILTAGGVYGLQTESVNARVREFGVRAAVGAAPRELVFLIVRETLALAIPGLALGATFSVLFARVIQSEVDTLSAVDPLSIAIAAVFLLVLTLLSAWLPARRAAAVDPATALRSE